MVEKVLEAEFALLSCHENNKPTSAGLLQLKPCRVQ